MTKENPFARKTGSQFAFHTPEVNDQISSIMVEFEDTFVKNPIHAKLFSQMDSLAMYARKSRGKRQRILRSLARSGSGKTTVALSFANKLNAEASEGVPVIYYSLENDVTLKRLLQGILETCGYRVPDSLGARALQRLMYSKFAELGVVILILDEAHNLVGRIGMADIVNFVKGICNKGLCSLFIMGVISDRKVVGAESIFIESPEVGRRVKYFADIRNLTSTESDRDIFAKFLSGLNEAIQSKGIFSEPSDFVLDEAVDRLLESFDGVIGLVADLIKEALEIALRRKADRVEFFDLALAMDSWAIPNGLAASNPFKQALK